MCTIGIEKRSTQADSLGTQSEGLYDIGARPEATINHDLNFVEQIWPENTKLVEDIDRSRRIVGLTTSMI